MEQCILAVLEDVLASAAHARKTVLPVSLLHSLLFFGKQFVTSSADALEANARGTGAHVSKVHQRRLALRATAACAISTSGSLLGVGETNNWGAALGAHALSAEALVFVLVHALRGGEGGSATRAHALIAIFLAGGLQYFFASAANAVHTEFSVVFQDVTGAIHEGLGAVGAHAVLAE